MEQKIKEIVSLFIRVPAELIGPATPVGRTAVQSSILLHRMYARLREEGVVIDDYAGIKMFRDILRQAGSGDGSSETGPGNGSRGVDPVIGFPVAALPAAARVFAADGRVAGVGIDIEELTALPRATDFRTETFYTQNFTPGEISYCILQADPYASFAGLFAAKEAIVKADAQYRLQPFHTVEIGHSTDGRPAHPGFDLSISHAGGMAVAVAVNLGSLRQSAVAAVGPPAAAGGRRRGGWLGWIALLLAAAALLVALKH